MRESMIDTVREMYCQLEKDQQEFYEVIDILRDVYLYFTEGRCYANKDDALHDLGICIKMLKKMANEIAGCGLKEDVIDED